MRAAVELVEPGMRLGLGSGRAVWAIAEALGTSGARPELVVCAAPETARRALAAGLVVVGSEHAPELDLALDGADEVTRELAVLKGGGGALLREKIVIESARRCVIVAETRKLVSHLGEGWRAAGRGRALRLGAARAHACCGCSTTPSCAATTTVRRS